MGTNLMPACPHRTPMKHIGFLSFGHWTPSPQLQTRSASDALLQSIELAVAAEQLGADGAYFRVHHFARQLGSPFPLLAACGARTKRIEIGTAVIDMRYENPLYMAEDAGAADLIAGGRLQLGISRGSPEQVIDGWRHFGYAPGEGMTDADMARRHTEVFLEVLLGKGFAKPNPSPMFPNPPGLLRLEPYSEGLRERIWWGAGTNATAEWAAKLGMNLQSSTLKIDESGKPFHVQQAEQIRLYRAAWKVPLRHLSKRHRRDDGCSQGSQGVIAAMSTLSSRTERLPIGIAGVSQGQIDREVPANEPPPLAPNADLAVVGKPVPRVGGRAMVTGAARYTVDVKLPGMLIARILRSPHPHARILSVSASR